MSVSRDMLRLPSSALERTPMFWPVNEVDGLAEGLLEVVLKRVGVCDRMDESLDVMEVIVTVISESSGGK